MGRSLVLSLILCLYLACAVSPSSLLIREIYREFNIEVRDSGKLSIGQLTLLQTQLRTGPLAPFVPIKLKVIQIRDSKPGSALSFGSYDPYSETIYLTADENRFEETLIHEVFHVLSFQYPVSFQTYLKTSGWSIEKQDGLEIYHFEGMDHSGAPLRISGSEFDFKFEPEMFRTKLDAPLFPSEYSKLGPYEMFAEAGTATVLIMSQRKSSNYELSTFSGTKLFEWVQEFIKQGKLNP